MMNERQKNQLLRLNDNLPKLKECKINSKASAKEL